MLKRIKYLLLRRIERSPQQSVRPKYPVLFISDLKYQLVDMLSQFGRSILSQFV